MTPSASKNLKILVSDPLLFSSKSVKFIKARLRNVLYKLYHWTIFSDSKLKRVFPWTHGKKIKTINGIKFEFDLDLSPHVCLWYVGAAENSTVELMKRFLKKGDTFIDIGANIGYISALAAGLVGKEGQVHCFEPVPKYYAMLRRFAENNKDYKICTNECALGDRNGDAAMDVTEGLGMSTLVQGLRRKDLIEQTIEIKVERLDDYIFENRLENISMIKLDVEGYELNVLKGLSKYLKTEEAQKTAICVEIMPYAYKYLGYTLHDLAVFLEEVSFTAVGCDIVHLKDDDPNYVTNALLLHKDNAVQFAA